MGASVADMLITVDLVRDSDLATTLLEEVNKQTLEPIPADLNELTRNMMEAKETSTAIKKYMEYLRSLVLFVIIIMNNYDDSYLVRMTQFRQFGLMAKYDFEPTLELFLQ